MKRKIYVNANKTIEESNLWMSDNNDTVDQICKLVEYIDTIAPLSKLRFIFNSISSEPVSITDNKKGKFSIKQAITYTESHCYTFSAPDNDRFDDAYITNLVTILENTYDVPHYIIDDNGAYFEIDTSEDLQETTNTLTITLIAPEPTLE